MHQLLVLLLVLSVFFINLIEYSDAGKKKGQQIIMSGGGLVFKDEKKKKGDTIIIKDSCPSCSCGGKKIKPIPIPIMMAAPPPRKEIKVVHVPQKEVKVIHVPVHHHDSWGHGFGDMHEASFHGGWAARADEHEQMFEDAAPRSLGIGEKPLPSSDNVGYDFEDDPTQFSGVPMTSGMVQNDFMPDYSD